MTDPKVLTPEQLQILICLRRDVATSLAKTQKQPYCPSCHKRGEPVKCWVCKMEMCFRCALPHGAKSVCERCIKTL